MAAAVIPPRPVALSLPYHAGRTTMRTTCLCLLLLLGACGPGGIQPGARYSGMPDTITGDAQKNQATGTISTDGTVWSRQQGYLTTPSRR
jgi:hypothetical protein